MNGSIYIRNKNGNYLITRELDELPKRSSHLPLPPLTSEDAYTTKLKYMAQLQEERLTKQQAENRVKQEERIRLSLLKQEFYKTHRQ